MLKLGQNIIPVEKFQHYRLVLHQVARPIESFRNTKELVRVILDALEAYRLAHDNANILHRDISAGNVMITEGGRGLLIDWDLSKNLVINPEAVSPAERTGTWQFISARLIMARAPGTPVPVPNRDDDLESFWHVLLWTTIRHCEHTMSDANIVNTLCTLFDYAYLGPTGQAKGGLNKRNLLMSGDPLADMNLGSHPIRKILSDVADILGSRYPLNKEKEDNITKVQEIWDTVRMKNPDFQEEDLCLRKAFSNEIYTDEELDLSVPIWRNRRKLAGPQWMEAIFQAALNDPQANWATGSTNVERSFSAPRERHETKERNRYQ